MGVWALFVGAQDIPLGAEKVGGAGGVGLGLGAGITMAQTMMNAMKPAAPAATTLANTKFCVECGHAIPRSAKFCPECGKPQAGT